MKDNSRIKILTPVNIVGFILVVMAGWIDTVGLQIFANERVSFMTGRAAELGERIAKGDMRGFSFIIIIVIIFIVGATISAKITRKWGLIGGLTFSGVLLMIAAFCTYEGEVHFVEIAIPMAMGGQNAATSLTPINRTTHLTGPATDIGVYLSSGNWNGIIFWLLRWIGFPIGSFIGFKVIGKSITQNHINRALTLIIPAIIIISTGIVQKMTVDIPLLEDKI
ncbi:YoaK family protein [uncultured Clostridium sp.]|uniref:YoaK family protein n=1 Tax=uncultured Clostridium sp. TaxID=59620 RepID=UPI0028E9EFC1|nr:YoaK family protein [uncultured Clostridium sp.]